MYIKGRSWILFEKFSYVYNNTQINPKGELNRSINYLDITVFYIIAKFTLTAITEMEIDYLKYKKTAVSKLTSTAVTLSDPLRIHNTLAKLQK